MQPSTRSCVGGVVGGVVVGGSTGGGVGSQGTGGGSGGRGGRCDWRLPVVGRGTMCCFGLLTSRTGRSVPRSGCLASAGATGAAVVGLGEKTVVGFFMLAAWRWAAASTSSAVVLVVGGGRGALLAALACCCAKRVVWADTCGTAAGASS